MRIVIDMQGAQTESRFRGIGRYTLGFTKAILQNCGNHEVIIVLNGLFGYAVTALRAEFENILPPENILVWTAPGPVCGMHHDNSLRQRTAEILREAFIASLNPDILHVTSFFEGFFDDAVTSIGRLNTDFIVSVTAYDLIPLLNPEQYLDPNPSYKNYYLDKIKQFKSATCYQAISDSASEEYAYWFGLDKSQLNNILGGIENIFEPLELNDSQIAKYRSIFNIHEKFILCVGASDERKNLPRLIQAFGNLPKNLLDEHSLVLVGRMPENEIAHFRKLAKKAGFPAEKLHFVGYIDDEQLVILYNLCALYILPSWHEGLGLTAAEAMACGAPVIGSNTSSIPEVIGHSRALFNPHDVSAMTEKITEVLEDDALRNILQSHGIKQSKVFHWASTGKRVVAFWEQLISEKSKLNPQSVESSPYQAIYRQSIEEMASILADADPEIALEVSRSMAYNEQQSFAWSRNKTSREDQLWRIEGPFDSTYSLALLNREIARALANHGAQVALSSTEGLGDFDPAPQFLNDQPDLARMHNLAKSVGHAQATVVSRNLYPPRVHDMHGSCNLLHSYAWEESGFPMEWVRQFNDNLDGVACLSEHVRKVLRDNGVSLPLSVSGCGVDHWERVKASKHSILDEMATKAFRFLHVSSFFPRKGPDALLDAWCLTFSKTDNVCLVIKTFPNPHNRAHEQLSELKSHYPDAAPIIVIEDDMTDSDLKALYERCHVLVAPSYAEGFCLPIAEAMLSGLPAITTNWSGQLDFCQPNNAWLVDYMFEQADTHFDLRPSVWAKIDTSALAKAMKTAYETSASDREKMACNGRELLLADFSWDKVAERLLDSRQSFIAEKFDKPPKIGWISTWNTKCGIATYSGHLVAGFKDAPFILAANTNEPLEPDLPNWVRCWNADGSDALTELSKTIEDYQLDTLVIQFNFGFFHHDKLSHFVKCHKKAGRTVVLEMHAVVDPPQAPEKKLANYIPALALSDRVLVHSIDDLNLLKKFGLVENTTLFPHGVLEIAEPKHHSLPIRTITTYGFCLPHKGLQQMIDAVAILRDRGDEIALKMVNAEYPADISANLAMELRTKIKQLGLEEWITLETRFLPDHESLALLQASDLVVFAYMPTSESASGAARYGLASGTPTMVTDIAIFRELGDAVWRVNDTDPQNLANAIKGVVEKIRTNASEHRLKQEAARAWREQHSFVLLSERLEGMLKGLHKDTALREKYSGHFRAAMTP